ncbi:MAG TPA: AprI/Inh family metalloprotease inhibitor [Bauldia sp.]|nr:AprI/Inh family metalloprotease inhibitor [Bauldia sp.]
MPFTRFVPIALAVTLCGCGSIGAIGLPPSGAGQPPPGTETAGLPPPLVEGPSPTTSGAVITEPLPDPGVAPTTTTAAAPPATRSGALGRTDLLGGWTIASSSDSCQLFMTLTSWTGGYRASTRNCNSSVLKSISAWNLEGNQVILAGQGGSPVARLNASGGNRFDGQAEGLGQISFYR